MFIGIGYDAHKFKEGRKLVLGGVIINHHRGLDGHSDADVIIHALMDSILGAAGLDDIGHFFPNTNKKLKGISSLVLLDAVISRIKEMGLVIINSDITLIAQEPKISPFIESMKKNIAKSIGIEVNRIGIKATTNEKMGFIGRNEGMAAIAVSLLNNSTKMQSSRGK